MKSIRLLGFVVCLLAITFTSCQKKTELSKEIPLDKITIRGESASLFELGDPIQVMLVSVDGDDKQWEVRTNIPFKFSLNSILDTDLYLFNTVNGATVYVNYVDNNNKKVNLNVKLDESSVKTLLESDGLVSVNVPIVEVGSGDMSYKNQKSYFDCIDGIDMEAHVKWTEKVILPGDKLYSIKIDRILDELERCVNECVNLMNRQDRGENVSDKRIDDLLDRIDSLDKSLDNYDDHMSGSQLKRYSRLINKIDDAI